MRRTTEEMIVEYLCKGYELVLDTISKEYVEEERLSLKADGYDARWWTIKHAGQVDTYVLYAKKIERKSKKSQTPVDYSKFTAKDLKKICSEKKIPKYSKMNKDEMVAALTA